jgi:SNF2 family DNA or RNA helicase
MISSAPGNNARILSLLKRHAPPSVIDRGRILSQSGQISETSKSGTVVVGVVREEDGNINNVSLDLISSQDVIASCSCCSPVEMSEQWCHHAVALFWKADEIGFFDINSGFPSTESTFRMNISSSQDIANIISEIGKVEHRYAPISVYSPKVTVLLDLASDRLGIKVLFNGENQGPAFFEGFAPTSSRALDTLLLHTLEDDGHWDNTSQTWYVNSSSGIEKILGLIQEYTDVFLISDKKQIIFERQLLSARLDIQWQESGVSLKMYWVLPSGEIKNKDHDLLGTGPYWTCIDHTIYRLSPTAARVASIFAHSSTITYPRSQVAPILEALTTNIYDDKIFNVLNPDLQPESKIATPTPTLKFYEREATPEHFGSSQTIQIHTSLEFRYPQAPKNKNIVFLPDRNKERECIEHLKSLGFSLDSEKKRYVAQDDWALDILSNGEKAFPNDWILEDFEQLKGGIRFSNLGINVSISGKTENESKQSGVKGLDWFDCHVSLVRNNANIPLSTIFKNARSETDRWVKLDNGSYARIPGGSVNYLKTTLGILDPNFRLSNTIKSKLSVAQAISLARIEDSGFKLSVTKEVEDLSEKFRNFKSIATIKPSSNFTGKLRSYQSEGLSWLSFLHDFELGGILADEMGLGKTVQTLAHLLRLKESKKKSKKIHRPALIIAPTSVIMNWLYESRRFTPSLKTLLLHGPSRKQHFSSIPDHDIVITSYALLRIDRYDLEKYDFSYCILDEAQNIKNAQAATTKAAKSIRAAHRLALSGTPTENRPMELWSILDFLMPGYLGSVEFFRNYIEKPILEGGPGVQVTKFLNSKTRPFILRRTKAEVEKDLPPKVESVVHVEMTPSQAQLYAQVLEEVRPRVFEAVNKKGIRGASISILAALLRLRQICNHPNSIESLKELPGFDSGKFNLLKDILEEALEANRKILLFSQFKEMLAIIRRWLQERGTPHLYLDGATKDRQSLIDRFNSDESQRIFLISLKAGGTGLNLTAADTVVIYDPWWNPAVESQAVDRAHRIGQSKTVSVYRLVTENSVEQKIMDLKEKKSKIVDALINENGLTTAKLSKADLESLFTFDIGSIG